MKILYVTTIGGTVNFFKGFIKELLEEGHIVDIACNNSVNPVADCFTEWNCTMYSVPFSRSPLKKDNILAIKKLKSIVEEKEYDIVHCHTPIAAMCTRMACIKARKNGTKVFYTAHGFHFYKGAPLKNWLIYYPIEKICSFLTDVLITINTEDYGLACRKMKAQKVVYVPGVGVDLEKFDGVKKEIEEKRKELGIPTESILLISVGELNKNKNHQIVIKAMDELKREKVGKLIHYCIAGEGQERKNLEELARQLGLEQQIHLLGFRKDISELLNVADVYILPSIREGLNVSIMEAMASGLPCVVGKIRGNVDLVDANGGTYFEPCNVDSCVRALKAVLAMNEKDIGNYNQEKVKKFGSKTVNKMILDLYMQ